jgi:hypothetical protein
MGLQMCMGAMLQCSFGAAPSSMNVLPTSCVMAGKPVATIMDNKPFVNIMPFGMCTSPANPMVAAAMGAPMPCIPNTTAPWIVGAPTLLIGNMPALNDSSMCMCMWGGVIKQAVPGQFTVQIP